MFAEIGKVQLEEVTTERRSSMRASWVVPLPVLYDDIVNMLVWIEMFSTEIWMHSGSSISGELEATYSRVKGLPFESFCYQALLFFQMVDIEDIGLVILVF